jgi:hypothetical protein
MFHKRVVSPDLLARRANTAKRRNTFRHFDVSADIIVRPLIGPYEAQRQPSGASCFHYFNGRITSPAEECTIGNALYCVVYA